MPRSAFPFLSAVLFCLLTPWGLFGVALWAPVAVATAVQAAAPVAIVDDQGQHWQFPGPPQRVVTLAPHLTELVFAAGGGGRMVGAAQGSDYPDAARALPQIGDSSGIDLERVLSLRPDLVLAWGSGNRPADLGRMRHLGLAVMVLEPRRLDDIPRHLRLLGRVLGTLPAAEAVSRGFEARQASLRQRYGNAAPVSVLFEVWPQPLMTINGAHLISDVLGLCGGRNVFADLPQLSAAVSMETVLRIDPQAIVIGSGAADAVAHWQRHRSLAAVRNGHVFRVPPDLISRQTPRVLDAAELICADLERVREVRS